MFGLNSGKCKRHLQQAMSKCFDPLKGEIGNVPPSLNNSQYITGAMLGICEAYASNLNITKPHTVAVIVDAVFEEVFRADATSVLNQVDHWKSDNEKEFIEAYQHAKSTTQNDGKQLNIDWLRDYAVKHFEPSRTLML